MVNPLTKTKHLSVKVDEAETEENLDRLFEGDNYVKHMRVLGVLKDVQGINQGVLNTAVQHVTAVKAAWYSSPDREKIWLLTPVKTVSIEVALATSQQMVDAILNAHEEAKAAPPRKQSRQTSPSRQRM